MRSPICLTICLAVLAALNLPALAAPYIPRDGKQVVEHLPARLSPAQRNMQAWRQRLSAQPNDLDAATTLARLYIERARQDGDPRYLGYAQAALAPWWNMADPPVAARLLRATLLQSTHQFPAALADLNVVLKEDRGNAQAWLTRATVLQVQGQYAQAKQSCLHLLALAPPLIAQTCLANVASLNGEADAAYRDLSAAYAKQSEGAGLGDWVPSLLAEMAQRRGDARSAQYWYGQAFKQAEPDSYLLAAYADFLLEQRRAAEAALLLRDKTRVDALLLRYALALQATHDPAAAEQIELLQQRFDAAGLRGDSVHRREQARFELELKHNPAAALALARANWEVQKEPADARIYLQAALAAGQHAAAAPLVDWLRQNRLQDSGLQALLALWQRSAS